MVEPAAHNGAVGGSNPSAPTNRRGYCAIGLFQPKDKYNVGAVLRAAFVYDANFVVTTGRRYKPVSSDTINAYKHLPLFQTEDLFDIIPYSCIPVAVDLLPNAIPLPKYNHPERAFYIFGPEDGTLGSKITDRCKSVISVPTKTCMNLAACVNVILYDRMMKKWREEA